MSRPKGSKNRKPNHKWTNAEKEYLKLIIKGSSYKEIAMKMSAKFGYDFSPGQIKGIIARNKLTTDTSGHFKKGSIPWNKGTKGLAKANKTSFKKGHTPANYRPIGSERIDKDGYVVVKVADPKTWKLKHRYIWEMHHNKKVQKGHSVIFLDGNKRNFNINNLMLVSRTQLLVMNKNKLKCNEKELTKIGINLSNLIIKTSNLMKKI